MKEDEQRVADFLKDSGLIPKPFAKEEKGRQKTPDFRVFKDEAFAFYCEVKSINKDDWLDKLLEKAPSGTSIGGERPDPILNRISDDIHTATKQFDSVNPAVEDPNVLALVNNDKNCSFLDLFETTTGCFWAEGNNFHPSSKNISDGRIKEEKWHIHLYLWLDSFKPDQFMFNFVDDRFVNRLCSYFGKDPGEIKKIQLA